VEFEQHGEKRAAYGETVLRRLSSDLAARYGAGFSERNVEQMRLFYLLWPIPQTLSAKSRTTLQTVTGKTDTLSPLRSVAARFPLTRNRPPATRDPQLADSFRHCHLQTGNWSLAHSVRVLTSPGFGGTMPCGRML